MKKILKFILKHYLRIFAKLYLLIYHPRIIAIAGSMNKYFVKEKIKSSILSDYQENYSTTKSYNTEIGLSLDILSLQSGYNSYGDWIPVILKTPLSLFKKPVSEILVLEYGISDPGDAKFLLSIAKPSVVILTDITQRYLGGFKNINELIREYELLLKSLESKDLAILNFDNVKIKKLKNSTKAVVRSFAVFGEADYHLLKTTKNNTGQILEIKHKDSVEKYDISRFGNHHVQSLLIDLILKEHYASLR